MTNPHPPEASRGEAETVLSMIEAVDPADTAKLDEIDARVWCFVNKEEFHGLQTGPNTGRTLRVKRSDLAVWPDGCEWILKEYPKYCQSRDTLKAIRPVGYFSGGTPDFDEVNEPEQSGCVRFTGFCESLDRSFGIGKYFPAEELAELSAIIQAIDHERNSK